MNQAGIKLSTRDIIGKKVRFLRREGVVPVHMYGRGTSPVSLQVEAGILRKLLPLVGSSIPVSVEIEGQNQENICFVREIQRHPVTEDVLHVDFVRVEATQIVTADVPVILSGDPPAVQNLGGILIQPLQSVRVESLPLNMPASIELDISGLDDFEKSLRVLDLPDVDKITILNSPQEMVARVQPPRVEEEVLEPEDLEGDEDEGLGAPGDDIIDQEGSENSEPAE